LQNSGAGRRDFLRQNYNGRKKRLGSVGCAEDGSDGQDLAVLIVTKLQLGAPADLGGPIGSELLLIGRWGRWWWRRGFVGRWRGLRLRLSELRCKRDQDQHSKKDDE
jgi:hypothetical protein